MNAELIPAEKSVAESAMTFSSGAAGAVAIAEAYIVDSADMAQMAADERNTFKARIKALNDMRMGFTKPLDELKSKWMALFKPPAEEYDRAVRILDQKIIGYDNEQREIARKAREAAERAAAEERRIAREAEEAAAREAEQAAASGNTAAAEAAQAALAEAQERALIAEHTPAPVVQMPTAKVSGISRRENWQCEVTDMMALVKAIAAGQQPISLIEPNMTALNGMARSLKEHMNVPGVRSFAKAGLASR